MTTRLQSKVLAKSEPVKYTVYLSANEAARGTSSEYSLVDTLLEKEVHTREKKSSCARKREREKREHLSPSTYMKWLPPIIAIQIIIPIFFCLAILFCIVFIFSCVLTVTFHTIICSYIHLIIYITCHIILSFKVISFVYSLLFSTLPYITSYHKNNNNSKNKICHSHLIKAI